MDTNKFIQNFADLFEETEVSLITPETKFRDLDEWSSLLALSTMSMIDEEYDVQLTAEQMRGANTVQDLINIVNDQA